MERVERRLTAILAADVAGYSRLMGADEEGTLAQLNEHRRALVDPKIAEHRGRIVKTTGDGLLATFAGPAQALHCAVAICRAANREGLHLRAGVHVGEVELVGSDVRGVAVHEAARIMATAGPGEILVSEITRTVLQILAEHGEVAAWAFLQLTRRLHQH